ncbi:hypothetical protein [Levilactobacillus brevis]|uniref:hypothetical protein n=1 Tax=Levilactobacillus brevis TaxID=1580 RepID=UPI00063A8F2B|nr:hypothetical protein [Levilactobacillus brevis]KLE28827.1 hypothetical protein AAX72_11695 [Levilactobacillus brevis]MCT3579767.1 DUF2758 domain-containing protein [Levilactobacillus brevis]
MIKTNTVVRPTPRALDMGVSSTIKRLETQDYDVLDVKFSTNACGKDEDSALVEYCAMIIYK